MEATSRRELLISASTIGVAATLSSVAHAAPPVLDLPDQKVEAGAGELPLGNDAGERRGDMLYRTLGKTGVKVSAIGLGGHHIGTVKDEAEAIRIMHAAIDRGLTFMDNCWDYHNGKSEELMGKGLKDGGRRDKVFLMSKIDGRTKKEAAKQIDESLKRLQTDHVDLMQHHEIIRMEDADRIFNDGAHEAMVEARKAGKIKFMGFTGHKDPIVFLRMIDVAGKHDVTFDTAQFPLNVMDAHFRSFAHLVVPELQKRGTAILGMKPLASGAIMKSNTGVTAVQCLHYALSLPTSVVITGIDSMERLEQAFEAVKTFKPMTREQVAALLEKTKAAALTGKFERFKTAADFDGTAKNPKWLG